MTLIMIWTYNKKIACRRYLVIRTVIHKEMNEMIKRENLKNNNTLFSLYFFILENVTYYKNGVVY